MPTGPGTHRHLVLFGTPALEQPLPLEKPFSLLYYLALQESWVSRDHLAFLYRPDSDREVAQGHLRVLLHRARAVPWATALEVERTRLRFPIATDVAAFRAAIARGAWATALDLYTGDLLDGLRVPDAPPFHDWLEDERRELHALWRGAVFAHSDAAPAEVAAPHLRALLRVDPLDEDALQHYLRTLHASGDRHTAQRAYEAFRDELARELDVEPLASTQALLHAFTPTPAEAPRRGDLPTPTTRFVGRADELALVEKHLADDDCRLLSIVGAGGSGKTRLALEIARRLAAERSVRFVELDGLPPTGDLAARIAEGMGIGLTMQLDPLEQIKRHVGSRRLLLVLDMLDHHASATDLLLDLLAACPGLDLLVTSRERLGAAGEWAFPLGGLRVPDSAPSLGDLLGSDAPALFVRSARRARLDLEFGDADAADLLRVCRAVGGSPLGLELAAAWLRVIPLQSIAEQLERGPELLASPTLAAVLERSWRYLDPHQRDVLLELSVFRGGVTLADARALTRGDLESLTELLDRSLVTVSDEGRYDLHPLTRAFLDGKSAAGPELLRSARERHGRHFLGFLANVGENLHGHEQLLALQRLERELDNVRAAWDWAVAGRVGDAVFHACEQLYWFFTLQGRFGEALAMTRTALRAFDRPDPERPQLVGRLLMAEASCLGRMNSGREAIAVGERSVDILDRSPDPLGRMAIRLTLAAIHWRQGDYRLAQARIQQARERFDPGFARRWQGQLLGVQALVEARTGSPLKAMITFQRALDINRRIGNRVQSVVALYGVGTALMEAGKLRRAEAMLDRALKLAREIEYRAFEPVIAASLAQIRLARRNHAQARILAEWMLADDPLGRDQVAEADAHIVLGRTDVAQRALDSGRAHLLRGLTLGMDVQNQLTTVRALLGFGEYHLARGESAAGARLLRTLTPSAPAFEKRRIDALLDDVDAHDAPRHDAHVSLDEAVERVMTDHLEAWTDQI